MFGVSVCGPTYFGFNPLGQEGNLGRHGQAPVSMMAYEKRNSSEIVSRQFHYATPLRGSGRPGGIGFGLPAVMPPGRFDLGSESNQSPQGIKAGQERHR